MNNSTSVWQGACFGIIHKIKHNCLEDLKRNLDKYGSGIIFVNSLYSAVRFTDDLGEFCKLKHKYNCMLVAMESHEIGLYGSY